MTVWLPVLCPECHSSDIIRHGKSQSGKQRYLCRDADCLLSTFVLNTEQPGRTRLVKGKKANQRWLWHAIDRLTGQVLAYKFGNRKDEVFLKLKKL